MIEEHKPNCAILMLPFEKEEFGLIKVFLNQYFNVVGISDLNELDESIYNTLKCIVIYTKDNFMSDEVRFYIRNLKKTRVPHIFYNQAAMDFVLYKTRLSNLSLKEKKERIQPILSNSLTIQLDRIESDELLIKKIDLPKKYTVGLDKCMKLIPSYYLGFDLDNKQIAISEYKITKSNTQYVCAFYDVNTNSYVLMYDPLKVIHLDKSIIQNNYGINIGDMLSYKIFNII